MNVRHPMGVLHSFSIKNIFFDKMDLKTFLFSCDKIFMITKDIIHPKPCLKQGVVQNQTPQKKRCVYHEPLLTPIIISPEKKSLHSLAQSQLWGHQRNE